MKHRIHKKQLSKILDTILETGYFINCNYHPVKLTEFSWSGKDLFGSDVDGVSLINGNGCSCSLHYCRPTPITSKIAEEMVEIYNKQGNKGLAIKYGGWDEKSYEEFEKEWLK